MYPKLERYIDEIRQRYEEARLQVKRHWKKGVAVSLVVFIMVKKDVDIDVSLNGPYTGSPWPDFPAIWESVTSFASFSEEDAYPDFAIQEEDYGQPVNTSQLAIHPGVREEKKEEKSWFFSRWTNRSPSKPEAKDDNLANTFSNMTYSEGKFATEENTRARAEKKRKQQQYIQEFAGIARREMDQHGIPASITLAQGLLESNAGESSLSTRNNNHFGIKCFSRSCRKGHCSNFTDDHHKDFFRIYANPGESYRAHSQLLKAQRYRNLFKLSPSDYRGWAKGLKRAGYATDRYYAEKLINLIEELNLHEYDY